MGRRLKKFVSNFTASATTFSSFTNLLINKQTKNINEKMCYQNEEKIHQTALFLTVLCKKRNNNNKPDEKERDLKIQLKCFNPARFFSALKHVVKINYNFPVAVDEHFLLTLRSFVYCSHYRRLLLARKTL